MGARSVARAINMEFKRMISKEILFGQLQHGGSATIDISEDRFEYIYQSKNDPQDKHLFNNDSSNYDFETAEEAQNYAKKHSEISISRSSFGYGYIIVTR